MAALSPVMLLPLRRHLACPFPLNDPGVHYFYFARNGVYALAQLWKLRGEEVLFPAYCHGVELDALLAAGVRPQFYPVRDGMRVELEDVVSRLRPGTRAIYLIHYLGFPGPVRQLQEICRQRNLLLIEDCALALLSRLGEQPLGSFGDAAIFCLYKTLPLPNGGALVLRGEGRDGGSLLPRRRAPSLASTAAHAVFLLDRHFQYRGNRWGRAFLKAVRTLGKSAERAVPTEMVPVGTPRFDPAQAGLAMSRFCHWVLASQGFSSIVEKRRRNFLHLAERLRRLAPPLWDELAAGVCPLFYPLLVVNREDVVEKLLARGVEAGNAWSRQHPAVPTGAFPEAEQMRRTVMSLPCHQDLTSRVIDWMADQVCEVVRRQR